MVASFLIQDNLIDHQKGNWPIRVLSWCVTSVAIPLVSVITWPSTSVTVHSSFLNIYFFCSSCCCDTRNGELGSSSEKILPSGSAILSSNQSWGRYDSLCGVGRILCPFDIKLGLVVEFIRIAALVNHNT